MGLRRDVSERAQADDLSQHPAGSWPPQTCCFHQGLSQYRKIQMVSWVKGHQDLRGFHNLAGHIAHSSLILNKAEVSYSCQNLGWK